MAEISLRNARLSLRFDGEYGALIGLDFPEAGWSPLDRPSLGRSYRLVVPKPGRRGDAADGVRQRLSSAEVDPSGQELRLAWDGLRSEEGEALHVAVQAVIRLEDRRAVFELEIDNRSSRVVESVEYPQLGDVRPPGGGEQLAATFNFYGAGQEWPILPRYQNLCGYWGVDHPTQYGRGGTAGTPMVPFILLRGPGQGLYVGVEEPDPELVAWRTELHPGYRDAMGERAPDGRDLDGTAVAVRFAAVHLPNVRPGERRRLTPVVVEPYVGGWQQGADLYRRWRGAHLTLPARPSWVEEPHSWLQIRMNSPGDELRFRFTDLVEVGRECARHGIGAIQLVGWNDGGQDQNNPDHRPDGRLGTPGELREAMARVRAMGVRTVLFSKFTWADRATERFRRDLQRLAVRDPYGDYYVHGGYRYQTPAQLLDVDTKRLVPMCFSAEKYLRVCEDEFARMLELRPDGILFDECCHHGPALLCFDSTHGHRPGAPVYANDRELIRRFGEMARRAAIDFLFAGEGCYDWQLDTYHLSYHRSASASHVPLSRYLHPRLPLVTALTGFDDRNLVNQCLLYRYVMSYEPYNFKGRPEDFPLTLAYGKRMDALRRDLRAHLWDGEFRHQLGATVSGEGGPHQPFSVFEAADGSRCVAVANYREDREATVQMRFDGEGAAPSRWRLVEDSAWRAGGESFTIPPRCAAVAMER